jgi:hypothetical protein
LFVNNSRGWGGELRWNAYKPKGRFLRKWGYLEAQTERLYLPDLFSFFEMRGGLTGTFKNFMTCGINGNYFPFGTVDHFESRSFGTPLNFDPSARFGAFISSDYSKKFALDIRPAYTKYFNQNQDLLRIFISPRVQFKSRYFLIFGTQLERFSHDYGYVSPKESENYKGILIGTRNRDIITNTLTGEVIFTKRMGVSIRFRHYWQRLNYLYFNDLLVNGDLRPNDYFPLNEEGNSYHNNSFNAFTLDVNYRWVFFPGCEFLVFYKNNIFASKNGLDKSYFDTFYTLFDQPQLNSISFKIQLFVDALYFKKGGLRF